jgi:hypothetical protein
MNRRQPRTRREFAKDLAVLAAAPLATASDPPAARADKPKPADATQATAEALLEAVRARYGKHLTAEQLTAVQSSLARALYAAERLKKVKLQNSDEPAVIFSAEC